MLFSAIVASTLALASAAAVERRAEPIGRVDLYDTTHCTGTVLKSIDVQTLEDCLQFSTAGFNSAKWTNYRESDSNHKLAAFTAPTTDCTGSTLSVSDSTGCAYVLSDWAKLYAGRLYLP